MKTDDHGIPLLTAELRRTQLDPCGRQKRGLQNRLRGAAEASWVGSIPIHPRHCRHLMTAKLTARAADASERGRIRLNVPLDSAANLQCQGDSGLLQTITRAQPDQRSFESESGGHHIVSSLTG